MFTTVYNCAFSSKNSSIQLRLRRSTVFVNTKTLARRLIHWTSYVEIADNVGYRPYSNVWYIKCLCCYIPGMHTIPVRGVKYHILVLTVRGVLPAKQSYQACHHYVSHLEYWSTARHFYKSYRQDVCVFSWASEGSRGIFGPPPNLLFSAVPSGIQARVGPAKKWIKNRHVVSRGTLRIRNSEALTLTQTLHAQATKKYIKNTYLYFDSISTL